MPTQNSVKFSDSAIAYIGLDVHLKQWNVCIYHGGIKRKSFQQSPSVDVLMKHLESNYPGLAYHSAYEAGVCGFSIHYALEKAGVKNIVFNAADIRQTNKERARKTDSIDASKIARELSQGQLKSIHIPPKERVDDRSLLRERGMLLGDIKRLKARIRHFLHVNGIRIPDEYSAGKWPKSFVKWLKGPCSDAAEKSTAFVICDMTDTLVGMAERLKIVDKRIASLMQTKAYSDDYSLLMGIPGIGKITACTILLECGDLSEFSSAEKFCAFIGLVPDMNRSDEHEGKCSITRRRHKILRYMLTECAWKAISVDSHLSGLYVKYSRRMPRAKAIVKIANKLAKIIKFVMRNKTAYVQNA